MPLKEIELLIEPTIIPDDVATFLREADSRVDDFVTQNSHLFTGFVASNYLTIYRALERIVGENLITGNTFCEWGSGLGVVTLLASMLELDACGIEVERELVDGARQLAEDFEVPAEFIHGSFIPRAGEAQAVEACAENSTDHFWLVTEADEAYEELGLDIEDFDLTFAYPWPGEEVVIEQLFEQNASNGSLLLTHNQFDTVSLYRKVS